MNYKSKLSEKCQELGIQFPIYKDVGSKAAKDNIRLVFGVTITY